MCGDVNSLLLFPAVCRELPLVVALVSGVGIDRTVCTRNVGFYFCKECAPHRTNERSYLYFMDAVDLLCPISCIWDHRIPGLFLFCTHHLQSHPTRMNRL
jgi:hypothetical protein